MEKFFLLSWVSLLIAGLCSAQSGSWNNLNYGKYEIGFKQIETSDLGKPKLKMSLWYPAQKTKSTKLTLLDYLEKGGVTPRDSMAFRLNDLINGSSYTLSPDSLQSLLNLQFNAVNDAKMIGGKWPLLIWAPRHGTIYYQPLLNEYLASHGYVVVCAERIEDKFEMFWNVKDSTSKEKDFEGQVDDMERLFQYGKALKFVDSKQPMVLSWSYGGEMAQVFSQLHPELKVVIGLSSIRYENEGYYTAIQKRLNPAKLVVPNFLIYEKQKRNGESFTTEIIHPVLRPQSQLVLISDFGHGNFNFVEGMLPGVLNTQNTHPWSKGGSWAKVGYEYIAQIVLYAVQGHSKGGKVNAQEISSRFKSAFKGKVTFVQPKKD